MKRKAREIDLAHEPVAKRQRVTEHAPSATAALKATAHRRRPQQKPQQKPFLAAIDNARVIHDAKQLECGCLIDPLSNRVDLFNVSFSPGARFYAFWGGAEVAANLNPNSTTSVYLFDRARHGQNFHLEFPASSSESVVQVRLPHGPIILDGESSSMEPFCRARSETRMRHLSRFIVKNCATIVEEYIKTTIELRIAQLLSSTKL